MPVAAEPQQRGRAHQPEVQRGASQRRRERGKRWQNRGKMARRKEVRKDEQKR